MLTCLKKVSLALSIGSLLVFAGVPLSVSAATGNGVPFQGLQVQINALRDAVKQLSQQVSGVDKAELVACDNGDTLAEVLARSGSTGRLTATITGQCNEAINLTRDDVTLLGGSGIITGRIFLDGARRIVIDGLTLPGGIAAERGATVLIKNSIIDVGGDSAIVVRHGGFAEIVNNPLIRSQEGCAVQVSDGAEVRLQSNPMIQSNQADAGICSTLGLFRMGLARLRGGNIFVNGSGGHVFDVIQGSTLRQDGGFDSFEGDGDIARSSNGDVRNARFDGGRLRVGDNSSVRFRDSVLNGELEVFNMSNVEFNRNTVINGPPGAFLTVGVFQNSNVRIRSGNTVNGNMNIGERSQAFFDFGPGAGTVNGQIACNTAGSPRTGPIPNLALQLLLVPVFPPPPGNLVFTSGGDLAFAYRGAVVGTPSGNVTFQTCN